MAQGLILQRSGGVGDFLVNPRDYGYDAEKTKEAVRDFLALRAQFVKEAARSDGTVKIVRASDGAFKDGQVVSLVEFLRMVEYVLVNGGEMPLAELCPG